MYQKDYHYILGIDKNASLEDIKKAYRKLSQKLHPDKNDGDKFFEDRFKEINEAYEKLTSEIESRLIECPRCLGKKKVDWEDILRLNMKGLWTPGKCNYCGGKGKVDIDFSKKVPPNASLSENILDTVKKYKPIEGIDY